MLIFTSLKSISQIRESTVILGKQEWSIKNLDVSTFRNGEQIPKATTKEEWNIFIREKKPAWCYYKIGYSEQQKYGKPEKYGKLYNYWAVIDNRGLAPKGFHIPTVNEWKVFLNNFDSNNEIKNYNTNEFKILFSGQRTNSDGYFGLGWVSYYWCSDNNGKFPLEITFDENGISGWNQFKDENNNWTWEQEYNNTYGCYSTKSEYRVGNSIRCIKDNIEKNETLEVKSVIKKNQNAQIIDVLSCTKINVNSRILKSPNINDVDNDWLDGFGDSWTFVASKTISNNNGTFYIGQLMNPKGQELEGEYFINSKDWECQ